MSTILVPCIIAGGSGSRLWPVSRETMPKPFMRLADGQSLLQKTFLRVAALSSQATILTIINRELLFRLHDEYNAVNTSNIGLELILEPFGRNTAAAIILAALQVQSRWGDAAQILVLPADHLIEKEDAFIQAVKQARELADQGFLVTFGLQPSYPETGYGYIEQGEKLGESGYRVQRFVEKPNLETAETYLSSDKYLWNSGMFCMQASTLLSEAKYHTPELFELVYKSWSQARTLKDKQVSQLEINAEDFKDVPNLSIDVSLMERSDKVAVVPCELGWGDIGSWQSVAELTSPDINDNRLIGETILHDVQGCYIDTPSRLVAAIGVQDLIVIDTPDALLITNKKRTQDVKIISQQLKKQQHPAYLGHRTTVRPWGMYTVLATAGRYKIKSILVKPKASLSLQAHHHRSEHWVVVSGTAEIVKENEKFLLHTNESAYISVGEKHRLSNPGVVDLVIIEVQCGEYLGEDDIIRYEDVYGRVREVDIT